MGLAEQQAYGVHDPGMTKAQGLGPKSSLALQPARAAGEAGLLQKREEGGHSKKDEAGLADGSGGLTPGRALLFSAHPIGQVDTPQVQPACFPAGQRRISGLF